jgi:hypothetical protein
MHSALRVSAGEISGFRDFAFPGEKSGRIVQLMATSAASTCRGLKSILVDTQTLDFRFEGGIGDT